MRCDQTGVRSGHDGWAGAHAVNLAGIPVQLKQDRE